MRDWKAMSVEQQVHEVLQQAQLAIDSGDQDELAHSEAWISGSTTALLQHQQQLADRMRLIRRCIGQLERKCEAVRIVRTATASHPVLARKAS